MCLIAFGWMSHAEYPLIVAANRDEFYGRPTAPAQFWDDHPDVLAGRDLKAGGTWMGITRTGRWAAITNIRAPGNYDPDAPSRGALVSNFLTGTDPPSEYLGKVAPERHAYNGFNLLVAELASSNPVMMYLSNGDDASNEEAGARSVEAGIHGISNARLNTPWPKVQRAKRRFGAWLEGSNLHPEPLFELLADEDPAPDDELPSTGIDPELERALSSPFIKTEKYGTRSSTVVMVSSDGTVYFEERCFEANATPTEDRTVRFELQPE